MENALRAMQREIAAKNRASGMPLGNLDEEVIDNEGFGRPASALPDVPSSRKDDEVMALAATNPRASLEQYQLTKYPPKIQAIDLEAGQIIASNGKFAMEEEETRQAIAIAIRAMQRSFEKILQTLVDQHGLSAPTTQEGGDASKRSFQEVEGAATTTLPKQSARTGPKRVQRDT